MEKVKETYKKYTDKKRFVSFSLEIGQKVWLVKGTIFKLLKTFRLISSNEEDGISQLTVFSCTDLMASANLC
ncbi:hypothetical protein PIROE2DRAFT_13885 [Piromyces sp. E2]|nr:hypothetical protein PIROE2DRAFT_13885 [Piromyces sp. E2]|eukprot:OUM60377.1 hypothetical protein PIROE2DRAFT_13885 [Piromyces sp. E2]